MNLREENTIHVKKMWLLVVQKNLKLATDIHNIGLFHNLRISSQLCSSSNYFQNWKNFLQSMYAYSKTKKEKKVA